jgi:hypothetical protein
MVDTLGCSAGRGKGASGCALARIGNKRLRQSVQGVIAFYKNHGYEEVQVDPDVC